jgi:hypothetical protein
MTTPIPVVMIHSIAFADGMTMVAMLPAGWVDRPHPFRV